MTMENEDAGMLFYTFSVITAPFILPELVERVANMFNYLFSQMVGPQQKTLTLKDPENNTTSIVDTLTASHVDEDVKYSNCISMRLLVVIGGEV